MSGEAAISGQIGPAFPPAFAGVMRATSPTPPALRTIADAPTFWTTIVEVVFARPLLFAFFAAYAP